MLGSVATLMAFAHPGAPLMQALAAPLLDDDGRPIFRLRLMLPTASPRRSDMSMASAESMVSRASTISTVSDGSITSGGTSGCSSEASTARSWSSEDEHQAAQWKKRNKK